LFSYQNASGFFLLLKNCAFRI